LGERLGSLKPGLRADLVAFPCADSAEDPYAAIFAASRPLGVWLGGQRIPSV
jgi:cytosine/adenosine deaminase-related metal-dependent hydrolase